MQCIFGSLCGEVSLYAKYDELHSTNSFINCLMYVHCARCEGKVYYIYVHVQA